MPLYIQQQPSKSLADRLFTAEFDDALVDQIHWKNSRYDGCKVRTKEINKYTPQQTTPGGIGVSSIVQRGLSLGEMIIGNTSTPFVIGVGEDQEIEHGASPLGMPGGFQVGLYPDKIDYIGDTINPSGLNANLKNETTTLYISNTVIGGTEDPQFTKIQNHSYINIHQILLINPVTDEVQLIDKQTENFDSFHTFITNDLPTQNSFSIKLIDESIANNLKGANAYKVKMNKGFLLKTFDYTFHPSDRHLTENNSIYLYKKGSTQSNTFEEGISLVPPPIGVDNREIVRFRYGTVEMIGGGGLGEGHGFALDRIGPSFESASIIENKFTQIYYTGSYGTINEPSQPGTATSNEDVLKSSGLGSASKFIGIQTLDYLRANQEDTELHLTLFSGVKDFSLSETNTSSAHDERSIGTFEVDSNQTQLDIGGPCNDYLPKTHEIRLKGINDNRFEPLGETFLDDFQTAYITGSTTLGGCVPYGTNQPFQVGNKLQLGINIDKVTTASVFVQGGHIGVVGYKNVQSASAGISYGQSLSSSMSASNYYSGSFDYQLSFLDKDHTLITNLNKDAELFNGIGTKGIVIIPKDTIPKIKNNINFYLQQAGIIPSSPNTQVQLSDDIN